MRLSNFDLQRVLFSINQLASDDKPESLPERTFTAVRSLVPTDVVSFEGFGTDNYYEGPLWYAPVENVSNEMLAAMGEYVSDHPCFDGVSAHHLQESVRISDYMTLPQFKRTTIYNEFFRLLGTDRQIVAGLHVSKELTITCSLCRPVNDYTERDCQVIDLLTPHLTASFRQAQFIHRLKSESEQLQTAIELAKLAIITVDRELQPQVENATAERLLLKYFKRETAELPDELLRYVKYHYSVFINDEFYLPPVPYEKHHTSGKLIVRLIFHSVSQTTILLLEEVSDPSFAGYEQLGLTNRENQVLYWIGQGKTDGEIGSILKISIRTVQKHIENIFRKLGVETRTSAASHIL